MLKSLIVVACAEGRGNDSRIREKSRRPQRSQRGARTPLRKQRYWLACTHIDCGVVVLGHAKIA